MNELVQLLLSPKLFVLYAIVAAAAFIHFRGKERLSFTRQLTDHSTFMAPYNSLMYLFSGVPNEPILDTALFPDLARLRESWETIRDEARALYEEGHVKAAETYDDLAFNSFFRTGWKRFYLKWYDEPLPSARDLCPKTVELVESIPNLNAAMFALLGPRSQLVIHRDPFAGSLRYHLGLITPNSEDCRIVIDGTPHVWRDGRDVLFDETYLHHAVNDTDEARIILFADVLRPLRFAPVRALNRFVVHHMVKGTAAKNRQGDRVGALNKVFGAVYRIRLVGKRIKAWNKTAYYAMKYVLFGGILYLVFF
ncbi:MAG: aspartyl/asparaginyl beta-hydroxylase domain-containing protein [Thermoanaerobaculia bacterium]